MKLELSEHDYTMLFGEKPEQDDLERVNCKYAGTLGHQDCGICVHVKPVFRCNICFPIAPSSPVRLNLLAVLIRYKNELSNM